MSPIEELQHLDALVGQATDLEELRPIFERMTALSREHPDDFEVVLAVDQVRSHLVSKGRVLQEEEEAQQSEGEPELAAETTEPATIVPTAPSTDDFYYTGPPPIPVPTPPPGSTTQTWSVAPPPPTGTFEAVPPAIPHSQPVDAPPPLPPPAPPPAKPVKAAKPPSRTGSKTGRFLMIGAGVVVLAALAAVGVLYQMRKHTPPPPPAPTTVPVEIATVPPGASIQVNGEAKCKSNCRLDLPPGTYQLTALLEGFDPGTSQVTAVLGSPANVNMTLVAQTGSAHLLLDLDNGTVMLDGQLAGELQDGQYILDHLTAGAHTVRVVGKAGEAEFSFEVGPGKQPTVTGPVKAGNMLGVLVASVGAQAKVYSTSPLKVSLNGQPQGQAGPQGLDLKDVPAGDQTLSLGEGQSERKLVVSFGAAPVLSVFFKKLEVTTGTLVVTTNEDDVTVSLNGKEYRRKTQHGSLRVPMAGNVVVHVAKAGFQPEPDQKVEVKKGAEIKVSFQLKAVPRYGALQIHNAAPGTQIYLDDQALGRVGPDGSLSVANLAPGEHAIEVRREGFVSKRIQRNLKAGEALNIGGNDLALSAATGSLRLMLSPPEATATYRRSDDAQLHPVHESTLKLEPGNYIVAVHAPNYVDRTEPVTVVAGETRNIQVTLVKPPPVKPRPTVSWAGWSKEGEDFVRKGGNRVVVSAGQMLGTLTFTAHLVKGGGVFRGGRLRWFIEDGTGSTQYEVDKRHFQAKGPSGSRGKDRAKDSGDQDENTYAVMIEFAPDKIVTKMKSAEGWVIMDSQPANVGNDTKFGFVIQGNDEISTSDLHFTPR